MNQLALVIVVGFIAQAVALILAAWLSDRSRNLRLDGIKSVTDETHVIVNNQRTVMLRLIASLASRIAADNPTDVAAQAAAAAAVDEAEQAQPR